MSKTLTRNQIDSIKQTIAVYDRVFVSTISDQDVFDFVNDAAQTHKISFSDAASFCLDDFDIARAMELDY